MNTGKAGNCKKGCKMAGKNKYLTISAVAVAMALAFVHSSCKLESSPEGGAGDRPDSRYRGVQVGTITYSFRSIEDIDEVLQACVDAGISTVELMGTGIEEYLGAPKDPVPRRWGPPPPDARRNRAAGRGSGGQTRMRPGPPEPELTEEQKTAVETYREELKAWRKGPEVMVKYAALRKKFNDAGVNIHIYKWTAGDSPEDLDYSFQVARTLGAIGITAELGEENCRNLGAAAERAGMLAIFHNHEQYAEEGFDVDRLLAMSPANRLNFDAGHYYGYTGKNPVEFIEKYHDKIVSVHLKDKTGPDNEIEPNANQVWGQGDTPIREVLELIQENQWPIYCDIELEYPVKPWSNPVKEVRLCREYCRQILL
jgi:sugar phosphate isomerase/epimerase